MSDTHRAGDAIAATVSIVPVAGDRAIHMTDPGPPLWRSAITQQSLDGRYNAQLLGEHAFIDAEVQVDFLLTDCRHEDVHLFSRQAK